jgi:hypothetical protein
LQSENRDVFWAVEKERAGKLVSLGSNNIQNRAPTVREDPNK